MKKQEKILSCLKILLTSMKIKSDVIWALLLIVIATISFYLGIQTGNFETEKALDITIQQKEEQISGLEQKIHQLSEELTSRGIFSYPQATVMPGKNNSAASVLINLNGKDAIKNLEIERRLIKDYTDTGISPSDFPRRGTKTSIGTLNAHNPVAFEIGSFKSEMAVDLIYRSQGKKWHQYIRARKTPSGELKTFWVITNDESEVIDKHIDEGFPVNEEGEFTLGANRDLKYSDIRMNSIFHPYPGE